MAIDWGFAWQVSGVGFGVVFGVLVLLAMVIWLVGLVLNKISSRNTETNDRKEGG